MNNSNFQKIANIFFNITPPKAIFGIYLHWNCLLLSEIQITWTSCIFLAALPLEGREEEKRLPKHTGIAKSAEGRLPGESGGFWATDRAAEGLGSKDPGCLSCSRLPITRWHFPLETNNHVSLLCLPMVPIKISLPGNRALVERKGEQTHRANRRY